MNKEINIPLIQDEKSTSPCSSSLSVFGLVSSQCNTSLSPHFSPTSAAAAKSFSSSVINCFKSSSSSASSSSWRASQKLLTASCVCLVFMIVEVIAGLMANSLALITDASHLLSDLCSFLISLFAIWVSNKKGNIGMSFGYHRAEILGALFSVLLIWVVTAMLILEAAKRFIDPPEVNGRIMFITSVIGTLANLFMTHILKLHSHGIGNVHSHSHNEHAHDGAAYDAHIECGSSLHVHNTCGNKSKNKSSLKDCVAVRHKEKHAKCTAKEKDLAYDKDKNFIANEHLNSYYRKDAEEEAVEGENEKVKNSFFCCAKSRVLAAAEMKDEKGELSRANSNSQESVKNNSEAATRKQKKAKSKDFNHKNSYICRKKPAHEAVENPEEKSGKEADSNSESVQNYADKSLTCKHLGDYNSLRQIRINPNSNLQTNANNLASMKCAVVERTASSVPTLNTADVYVPISSNTYDNLSVMSQEYENMNLKAAYIHALGDLLQNIGVMIASALIWRNSEWRIADPVCTIIFAFFVLATTASIIKEATNVLMEGSPLGLDIKKLQADLHSIDGVIEVHDLHVWSISLGNPSLACHLVIDNEEIARRILQIATMICQKKYRILHTTIQTDFSINKSCCDTKAHQKCFALTS